MCTRSIQKLSLVISIFVILITYHLPRAKSVVLLSFFICLSFLYADEIESYVSISLTDCYAMLCNTATILYMCSQTHTLIQTCQRQKDTLHHPHRSLSTLNYCYYRKREKSNVAKVLSFISLVKGIE